jgi:hypothetical protein
MSTGRYYFDTWDGPKAVDPVRWIIAAINGSGPPKIVAESVQSNFQSQVILCNKLVSGHPMPRHKIGYVVLGGISGAK